jgi:hypothetical protein
MAVLVYIREIASKHGIPRRTGSRVVPTLGALHSTGSERMVCSLSNMRTLFQPAAEVLLHFADYRSVIIKHLAPLSDDLANVFPIILISSYCDGFLDVFLGAVGH